MLLGGYRTTGRTQASRLTAPVGAVRPNRHADHAFDMTVAPQALGLGTYIARPRRKTR